MILQSVFMLMNEQVLCSYSKIGKYIKVQNWLVYLKIKMMYNFLEVTDVERVLKIIFFVVLEGSAFLLSGKTNTLSSFFLCCVPAFDKTFLHEALILHIGLCYLENKIYDLVHFKINILFNNSLRFKNLI